MSSKTRVGLMGGSFDPIHLGHIAIAGEARDALQLSHVLFLPSGRPPHKAHLGASPAQRLEMTRLAVEPLPWAQASDVEVCRQGTIYTVDTLQILSSQHPEAAFYYIIGADTLLDLPNWRNTQKVCTLCRFICLHRPGVADEAIGTALEDLRSRYGAQVHLVPASGPDISSTEVRRRVARGQSTEGLLPCAVRAYIDRENLYRL
ncbi:MAG TPA: nicotinate (nicotinamide) nucleotide adenylyltransferase [Candidatus Spyradocola merdavium]|nr:nicotinate (nicotinamide) nucleotide adenylyltransferase [Candidatus Spyradocola merdavium]